MKEVNHKDSHTRFNSVDWFGDVREITIGGVGTIGSWLSLLLARTGDHTLIMYDDDEVELLNLSGQLFTKEDVGNLKTVSMFDRIIEFTEIPEQNVMTMKRLKSDSYVSSVCFSCFDNMEARKTMFEQWCNRNDRTIFIDGRMNIENYEVFTVLKGDEDKYRKTLFDDKDIPDQICSLKNTSHTGALIAGRMVTGFTNYLSNVAMEMNIRDTSFHFREDMQLQLITMKCQQK